MGGGGRPPLCVQCMKRPAPRRSNWEQIPVQGWKYQSEHHHLCSHCFAKKLKVRGRSRRGRRPVVVRADDDG